MAVLFQKDIERAGDEDRGIGPRNDPNDHGKGEVADITFPFYKQNQYHKENYEGSHNGSGEGFIDAQIDHFGHTHAFVLFGIFPNPVINNDRVIDGISNDREKGRKHRKTDLPPRHRKGPQGNQNIVDQGDDGAWGKVKIESVTKID